MHYTYSSEYPQAWIESKWPCGWYELTIYIYIYIYMCFLSSKPPTPPLRSRSRTSPWPRPRLQPVRCGQSSPVLVTEQPNSDGGHPKPTITDGLHMCVFYSWFMIDSVVRRLVFQLALYMLPRNQPETSSSQHTRRVVLSPCCTKMRPYMYIYIYIYIHCKNFERMHRNIQGQSTCHQGSAGDSLLPFWFTTRTG